MSSEARPAVPVDVDLMKSRWMLEDTVLAPDAVKKATVEEVNAADAVFAEKHKQDELAASLMNLWAGSLLLHDLAVDALREPADEETPQPKKPEEDKPEE